MSVWLLGEASDEAVKLSQTLLLAVDIICHITLERLLLYSFLPLDTLSR